MIVGKFVFPSKIFAAASGFFSLIKAVREGFARILVFSDSEKDRLAQPIIPRPSEFHLAHHYWSFPSGNASFRRRSTLGPNGLGQQPGGKKGTCFNLNFVHTQKTK
jgi:hypothetical protein